MAIEIERKFLLEKSRLPHLSNGNRFIQGYISRNPEVRFRISDRDVVLCIKKEKAIGHRFELEFKRNDICCEELDELISTAIFPPLVKTRYEMPFGDRIWEIDVYEGDNAGLITADVELPRMDHPLTFPDFVDPKKEITGDPRYSNFRLTEKPFKTW